MKGKNFSCNNEKGLRKASDFYETPYSLTRMLLEKEKLPGMILEPAMGNGAIFKVLREFNYFEIFGYDILTGIDFLTEKDMKHPHTIITNPPFSLAQEFILKAKEIAKKKIIFLLPLSYLHGVERYKTIFQDKKFPLKRIYVFTRYPMLGEDLREDGKVNTGMMVYAWYVWERKPSKRPPEIHWLDNNDFILRGGK